MCQAAAFVAGVDRLIYAASRARRCPTWACRSRRSWPRWACGRGRSPPIGQARARPRLGIAVRRLPRRQTNGDAAPLGRRGGRLRSRGRVLPRRARPGRGVLRRRRGWCASAGAAGRAGDARDRQSGATSPDRQRRGRTRGQPQDPGRVRGRRFGAHDRFADSSRRRADRATDRDPVALPERQTRGPRRPADHPLPEASTSRTETALSRARRTARPRSPGWWPVPETPT